NEQNQETWEGEKGRAGTRLPTTRRRRAKDFEPYCGSRTTWKSWLPSFSSVKDWLVLGGSPQVTQGVTTPGRSETSRSRVKQAGLQNNGLRRVYLLFPAAPSLPQKAKHLQGVGCTSFGGQNRAKNARNFAFFRLLSVGVLKVGLRCRAALMSGPSGSSALPGMN